jgi:hypothetical protein
MASSLTGKLLTIYTAVPRGEFTALRTSAVPPAARDGGHAPARVQEVIKETLEWLDRFLERVGPRE